MSAPLTDEQILKAIREAVQGDTLRLTRDVGPNEVTQPTHDAIKLVRAIESAVRAPLLAEIERLTAERDAAMADAERLRNGLGHIAGSCTGRAAEVARAALDAARSAT